MTQDRGADRPTQRVAEGDEIGGLLRSQDAGDLGHAQHVALLDGIGGDEPEGLFPEVDLGRGPREDPTVSAFLDVSASATRATWLS